MTLLDTLVSDETACCVCYSKENRKHLAKVLSHWTNRSNTALHGRHLVRSYGRGDVFTAPCVFVCLSAFEQNNSKCDGRFFVKFEKYLQIMDRIEE